MSERFPEEFSWKYNFVGDLKIHEWDKYFSGEQPS